MGTIKLRKWDVVEYLKTDEDRMMYLQACMDEASDDAQLPGQKKKHNY